MNYRVKSIVAARDYCKIDSDKIQPSTFLKFPQKYVPKVGRVWV